MSQKKAIFFSEPMFKIAGIIFNHPNSVFHIRKLSKMTGLSTTSVTARVRELTALGIIKVEKTDITDNIQADLESAEYRPYKRIFNLYLLEKYGVVSWLKKELRAEAIVLFGSYARGEDIEESDIDILITTKSKSANIAGFIDEKEKILKRKISLHILNSIEESPKEFKNAIANGITLEGYIKVA